MASSASSKTARDPHDIIQTIDRRRGSPVRGAGYEPTACSRAKYPLKVFYEACDRRSPLPPYTIVILTRLEVLEFDIFTQRPSALPTIIRRCVDYTLITRPLQFDTTRADFYRRLKIARENIASTKYLLYTISRYAYNFDGRRTLK